MSLHPIQRPAHPPALALIDQSQDPAPLQKGESHLEAREVEGRGEVVAPIVIGPLELLSLGLVAGLDVLDELVWGGPQVLGPKPAGRVAHGE